MCLDGPWEKIHEVLLCKVSKIGAKLPIGPNPPSTIRTLLPLNNHHMETKGMSSKRKAPLQLAKPVVKPCAKPGSKNRIDETRTTVSRNENLVIHQTVAETVELSSDSFSQSSSPEGEREDGQPWPSENDHVSSAKPTREARQSEKRIKTSQVAANGDSNMLSPRPAASDVEDGSDAEPTSPTFGDLIQGSTTVDVSASLAVQATPPQSLVQNHQLSVVPLSSTSLGTVLNQALRTDDTDLLESCLQTIDVTVIQTTINRLDSWLAGALLSKLAARMHRRPGRAFGLMKWVQWTLVAHGGALATQPELVKRLTELNMVLEERSKGLTSLLALKGKLDMLDQQMKFRRSVKTGPRSNDESEEGNDKPTVIYVEGEEDEDRLGESHNGIRNGDFDDGEELPTNNGAGADSDEDSEVAEGVDVEEVVVESESADEDEVDHDDVDDVEDEDEDGSDDEASAPPAKMRRTGSTLGRRN